MKKENILNTLIYIFTITTLLLMVYYQNNLTKMAWIIGMGATLIGILMILKKNNYGYLVFSTGFSLFLSVLTFTTNLLDKGDSVTFMICMSIFLLMVITFAINIANMNKVKKIYSKSIDARVSDLLRNPNTKKEYYQIECEYVINDSLYTVVEPDYIKYFIPRIGDIKKIRVNSDDYTDVFFEKRLPQKIYENGLVIGLIIVSLMIIISLFI